MEKKVEWRFFQGSPIFNMFDQREWNSILVDLVCPVEELVLDFYVNLRRLDNSLSTFIRGSHYIITPQFISEVFELPEYTRTDNTPYSSRSLGDLHSICQALGGELYLGTISMSMEKIPPIYHVVSMILLSNLYLHMFNRTLIMVKFTFYMTGFEGFQLI